MLDDEDIKSAIALMLMEDENDFGNESAILV